MRVRKLVDFIFVLVAILPPAFAREKPKVESAAAIHRAVEASDIWSAGSVRLRVHVKFLQVKAGGMEAEYEKIWISPKQWRAQLSSPEFTELSVGGDGQIWHSASAPDKPLRVWQFERALSALSQTAVNDKLRYAVHERRLAGQKGKLPCIEVSDSQGPAVEDCIDPDTGLLSSVDDRGMVYQYSDYRPFAGKLFPRNIAVFEWSTLVATAEVTESDTVPAADPKMFEPPTGADAYKACPEGLGLPLGLESAKLVDHVYPTPPRLPLGTSIDVLVWAIIGRDGNLRNVIASGPDITRNATLEAVRRWHYEPATVCGNPVEVPVSIPVHFTTHP